ncbi:1,4-alpha-glucan branching protein GlgB [Mycoplasmatota bacterium]|nr:1,4-alpha-glucan branching protein GlgB [Mycoplasmatota bacterium]
MINQPTDFVSYLFHKGELKEAFKHFGSHLVFDEEKNVIGASFCVYAPHAKEVSVIGDFNNWDYSVNPMKKISEGGIWYSYISGIMEYTSYKYEIVTWENNHLQKADPFAYHHETRPKTASKVYPIDGYKWNDEDYLEKQKSINLYESPISIYEFHFGTWKKKDNNINYSYVEMVDEVIPYILEQGFTHIELLPLVEHPYDGSWGYQGTGYYAATSRYGTPKDLMYFIDRCHQAGIGVILDFVPGHFCRDAHGLYMFDGEPTYEYPFDDVRENVVWGTANFDLGKNEVRSFLISSVLFWMKYYHLDGFRMDAIANIIYWLGDKSRGYNYKALEFIRLMNTAVFEYYPNALMIAEDSTDFPMVTKPVYMGGLGFNYKWNMGWMNDVLEYFEEDSLFRKYLHNNITFGLVYAFSENFILPFSHDEVVHGKRSLLNKMPGDYWQKFANFRLIIGFLMTHPGKKLMFMGGEFAHMTEWKDKEQLDWNLYQFPSHDSANYFVRDMINLYKSEKALYETDHLEQSFLWIDANNSDQSIFSYVRKSKDNEEVLIIIMNCTPLVYHEYKLGVPYEGVYQEIVNSDRDYYGGSNQYNGELIHTTAEKMHGFEQQIKLLIPPLGISILKLVNK